MATVSPTVLPSAAEGAILARHHQTDLPPDLLDPVWFQQHSPAEAYLRLTASSLSLTESQRWNIVAYLWTRSLTDEWTWAQNQYAKNCAACHGETGRGDGPAAAAINAQLEGSMMHGQQVAAFTLTPSAMGATSEVYYAKIRRGGMGTSMPGFGTIFDTAESWRLVHYLWWLTFNPDEPPPDHPPERTE